MNRNDVMLHTITRIVSFIILSFSIFMFFAGHNNPGGGFIGGLMTAAALLLLYVSFDLSTMKRVIRIYFDKLIALGLLISVLTGMVGVVFGYPFLTHFFEYYDLPFLGETELHSAVLFDIGIYLSVIGVALLIILTIAKDDE